MKKYHPKHRKELRDKLIEIFGGECQECLMTVNLEFAHKTPTGLNGDSRGSFTRIYDVIKYPECYMLLCKEHHKLYDAAHPQIISPDEIKKEVANVYHRSLSEEDTYD